jgi:hypothetical protein
MRKRGHTSQLDDDYMADRIEERKTARCSEEGLSHINDSRRARLQRGGET